MRNHVSIASVLSVITTCSIGILPDSTAFTTLPQPTASYNHQGLNAPTHESCSSRTIHESHRLPLILHATQNDDDQNIPDEIDDPSRLSKQNFNRRDVLSTSAFATLGIASSANAIPGLDLTGITSLTPTPGTKSVYKQAKRSTAYLVDSTKPPTLVPYRASREAAILKQLGGGSGTPKSPLINESINLNNFMNKAVFGTLRATGLIEGKVEKRRTGLGNASFVFMGMQMGEGSDVNLAKDLLGYISKPRRGQATGVGLAFAPLSTQGALEEYVQTGKEDVLSRKMTDAGVDPEILRTQMPILRFMKEKQLSPIACSPEYEDLKLVRTQGLEAIPSERRENYVSDIQGFIDQTQSPRFKLYTSRSLVKDFVPLTEEDTVKDFFAERILLDECIANRVSLWAVLRPDSLVCVVVPLNTVRYLGGSNGRIPRVSRFLSPDSVIDEDLVTTILLNPSAEETLSQTRYLRLEIGTSPDVLQYQTKVADYLWFSTMPKVNMLPRMMNER